ncbi:MAG: ABC transporter ATP-binding protein [Candidatus Cloacimonetes bacterium]|nr:ABC transporter ATP-binding protein [Candidatus Cloacimonadota bacterium]
MHGGGGGRGGGVGGGFQDDELLGKVYDSRLYRRLLSYLKPYLWMVVISFFVLTVITATELVLPLITLKAIDDYIVSDKALVILNNETQLQSFAEKYHFLKLKQYPLNGRTIFILPTKSRSKIDKPYLEELKKSGQLSRENFYFVKDIGQNQSIIEKYITNSDNQVNPQDKFQGWFRLDNKTIAVSQSSIRKIPVNARKGLRNDAYHSLMLLALIFLGLTTLRFIASYFQVYLTNYFSQLAMNDLRHDVFAHVQKMPVKFFDQNPVGRLVTRVTNDVRAIDEMLSSGVITIVQDVILIIAIVVLMMLLDWKLALVSYAILPFVILTIYVFKRKTRVIYREVRKHLAALNATLAEHIAGVKIIQLFNQYTRKRDDFTEINKNYFGVSVSQLKLFAFFRPIIHVSSQLAVAVIIWYGGGQILREIVTIGLLMAFTTYVHKLFEPINDFADKFNILQGALAGAERIFDLMDTKPEDYRVHLKHNLKLEGEISFDNVWLAYNEGEWVLKDVSFSIRPGEKIALVGHTGSGKTSIVNLILGMYHYQKGRILLDGRELHQYALADIRNNIGIVQQDVFIFSGTMRDNIALNNEKLTQEELEQVCRYVNADTFIRQLPQHYNEPVMERGATLSTGQRQLIAFARVLAYNPSIFILDEATSNIDTETEILIQDALQKVMQNRTSIIIAHRLSTIQHVDRIIVLHKGEIVEEGSHFELLEKQGLYYDLYRLQYT